MTPADISLPEAFAREQERLRALYRYQILDTAAEEDFDRLTRLASYICGTPISLITLLDHDRQWFKSRVGVAQQHNPREISFCEHAIRGDHVMEVPDATQDVRFARNPLVDRAEGIRFYAGAPLITPDGYKLGTLCVLDRVPRKLQPEQHEALRILADEVVTHLELRYQQQLLRSQNSQLLQELQQKVKELQKTLSLFSMFVPESIVQKALNAPTGSMFEAESRYITVLFCDIRGYTTMVEQMSPREAVSMLNTFYSVMTEVIKHHHGTVNQYVGDEIYATFGVPVNHPDNERNAVLCALDMIAQLHAMNKTFEGIFREPVVVGIGLNAGEVIAGTLGSQEKLEYSVTGDTVNTGKRIETLTKGHPNAILISENVYRKAEDLVEVKPWEPVLVKGKRDPLQVYEVLGRKAAPTA